MQLEKNQQSIEEVQRLVMKAKLAQEIYTKFSQQKIDEIVFAAAEAGYKASEQLARLAVDDTGMGRFEDKITKNQFGTRSVWESIRDIKTIGIIERNRRNRTIFIAESMGIVASIIPTTNPTSTALYNILIAIKGGNAVVISPHPNASACTQKATDILRIAAENAGAPAGLISCMTVPTIKGAQALMNHKDVNVIVATGGSSIVKAAYSSGTPAYGVGAGNVPSIIEKSANVDKAVRDIIAGKTFDNGVICSSEQAMIYEYSVEKQILRTLEKLPVHIVNQVEKKLLKAYMFHDGKLNTKVVGQDAWKIAKEAGFKVPHTIRALLVPISGVGPNEYFSKEKLSPVLAMIRANSIEHALEMGRTMVEMAGLGHTAAIHTRNEDIVNQFALTFSAGRLIVNSSSVHGSVGYTTELVPAFTLGSGARSGSITMDNISANHLINIKKLAYETHPLDKTGDRRNAIDRPFESRKGNISRILNEDYKTQPMSLSIDKMDEVPDVKPEINEIKYGKSGLSDSDIQRIISDLN